MDRTFCSRTIKRQAQKRTNEIMNYLFEDSNADLVNADKSSSSHSLDQIATDELVHVPQNEHLSFHEIQLLSGESEGEGCVNFDSSDICMTDVSESQENHDLNHKLKEWAVSSNIPHCHINSLLTILNHHHPNLPKDSRTLLATPVACDVKEIAGGSYFHFGVFENVKERIESNPDLLSFENLSLQINIDGLPLFKSSSVQFWPILGLVLQEKVKNPFVIGLFVGHTKPNDVNAFLKYFIDDMKAIKNEGFIQVRSKKNTHCYR